jgi:uncharacterized membrane protein
MSSVIESNNAAEIKKWAMVHYMLHIAGVIFTLGLVTLLAVVLNYFKRDDATGTFVRSHMDYMINSWWKFAIWFVIAWVIYFVLGVLTLSLGFWLLAWIPAIPALIFVVRMIMGLMKLSNDRPIV